MPSGQALVAAATGQPSVVYSATAGTYSIQPGHSEVAVEVENFSISGGANVQQYDWNVATTSSGPSSRRNTLTSLSFG